MILGRITAELLTDLPDVIRAALGAVPGDMVVYEVDGDKVVMKRAAAVLERVNLDEDDHPDTFVGNLSLFTEWADEHDRIYDQLRDR